VHAQRQRACSCSRHGLVLPDAASSQRCRSSYTIFKGASLKQPGDMSTLQGTLNLPNLLCHKCARVEGDAAAHVCWRWVLPGRHRNAGLAMGWLLKHCLCVGRASAGLLSSVCSIARPSRPKSSDWGGRLRFSCRTAQRTWVHTQSNIGAFRPDARWIKISVQLNPGERFDGPRPLIV
jgi:hypothetical protein